MLFFTSSFHTSLFQISRFSETCQQFLGSRPRSCIMSLVLLLGHEQLRRCVLQDARRPVSIAAAKAALGHPEAGAGAMGMLRTIARLGSGEAKALTHLRTVNPHVASILDSGKCAVSLPKQDGPGHTTGDLHMGISSFAFQV
jgi:acyl transferase domain-containing protein